MLLRNPLIRKLTIFILIFCALLSVDVLSQNSVAIFNEFTTSDTIDMGMCMPGMELTTIFNLRNLENKRFQMNGINPTYGVFLLPGHPDEFNEFFNVTSFPVVLEPNSQRQFLFKFQAFAVTSFPPRKNTARLRIGFFNPDSLFLPENDKDLVAFRDFVVIGRKTENYIDVFEKDINFDSIYVFPKDTIRKKLIVQNSSAFNLSLEDVRFVRSFNAEITSTIKKLPIDFSPYQEDGFQHVWDLAYYPRNIGLDTAELSFYYRPDSLSYPDSVVIRRTSIKAVGVQQDLGVIRADTAEFTFNSVNFGDVDVGQSKEVLIVLRTIGNIPFGVLSQRILQFDSNREAEGFSIVRKMVDSVDLQPFLSDTMIVRFEPTRSDTFQVRLVLESDIINRKIYGYADSVRYRTIILRGVGRQAEIASLPAVIDFGNITVSDFRDCPTRRDTLIAVSNVGNLELRVQNRIEPDNNSNPFKVEPGFVTIPGRESRFIRIIFDSIATQPIDYEAKLFVYSNSPKGKDSLAVTLKARGVYPDTMDIQFPLFVTSSPGRRVSIPLLIDKRKVSVARVFSDTITYNSGILNFFGVRKAGTASRFAQTVLANQNGNTGELYLRIEALGSERFISSDTLIILEFDTYLGNVTSTNLHFVNPRFGDGICERILSLNARDGSFVIDSVCGLEFKTRAQMLNPVRFYSILPNPATNEIAVNYEVSEQTDVKVVLINLFGEEIKTAHIYSAEPGSYSYQCDLTGIPPGLYFIDIRSSGFSNVKQLMIMK